MAWAFVTMPVAMLAAAFHDALEKRRLVAAKRRHEVGRSTQLQKRTIKGTEEHTSDYIRIHIDVYIYIYTIYISISKNNGHYMILVCTRGYAVRRKTKQVAGWPEG